MTEELKETTKLKVAQKEDIDANFTVIKIDESNESEIEKKADDYVNRLVEFSLEDLEKQKQSQSSVERMGEEIQIETAKRLQLLQTPLKQLSKSSDDGGSVATQLVNLKMEVEKLDPASFNFEAGWFSRLLGAIPGVGTPMKRYFTQFESAQEVIDAILNSLKNGRDELARDNITLSEDQKFLHASALNLKKLSLLGQKMDDKLNYKVSREFAEKPEEKKFIEENLLFPLRQKIMDFQQQLAVVQQGMISIDLIQRNNKELIRGVDRSMNVTVNALQVAATVAMALNNQKIVMDKIAMINATTDSLIAGTAKQLKTQGVEIQKQAASTQLDIENLKTAFHDISTALNDISQFRQQALPQMAQSILEMDKLTEEIQGKVEEAQKSQAMETTIDIKLD